MATVEQRLRELIKLYKDTARAIDLELKTALRTPAERFRQEEHLRQIRAYVATLEAELKNRPTDLIGDAYKQGHDLSRIALERQGITLRAANLTGGMHTGAIQVLSDSMLADLVGGAESMKQRGIRLVRQTQQRALQERQIMQIIGRGVIEGETPQQVEKRLRDAIRKEVDEGAKIVIKGRKYDPDYYAELVSRTMTRDAVMKGALNTGLDYDITLYQMSAHSNACTLCQSLQGKVYSVSGNDGWPKLPDPMLPHPNCEHVYVPFVLEAQDPDEVERLQALSNQKTFIHNHADLQRVMEGGQARKKPQIVDEDTKAEKRAKRKAQRDQAAKGVV